MNQREYDRAEALSGGSQATPFTKASLEQKNWDECGLEEKVERLRSILLQTEQIGQIALQHSMEAVQIGTQHQHGERGEVLMPIQRGNPAMQADMPPRRNPLL